MIRRIALVAMAAASAVLLSTSAAAQARSGAPRACFFSSQLSNWTDARNGLVYLRVGVNDVYELKLIGSCPDLAWAETIGVETRGGGSSICSGLDVNIIVPRQTTHSSPMRCMGSELRKLTREEARALPPKLRP
jgi:hypothetical protein